MKIHEYQAKEILRKFGIRTPQGVVIRDLKDLDSMGEKFRAEQYVVKAQIHAGGRGKGGGVKLAKNREELRTFSKQILGMNLITHQTGPEGKKVRTLLIEEALPIQQELYFAMVINRKFESFSMIASNEGGMEIEEVARKSPDKIITENIGYYSELPSYVARNIAYGLGLSEGLIQSFTSLAKAIYKTFISLDCSLVEINPLVITKDNELIALDAKVNFDNSGLSRHKELIELEDMHEEDPRELEARKFGLSYISLDGTIGCMVNGAGLAMATMDIIKLYGAEPANFLDVGGGTTTERIKEAFKILLSDANTKVVLVNIFGGIVHCDRVATGIIEAAKQVHLKIPLVVRLQGTHSDEGRAIIVKSGLPIITAGTMSEAAQKSVQALKERGA